MSPYCIVHSQMRSHLAGDDLGIEVAIKPREQLDRNLAAQASVPAQVNIPGGASAATSSLSPSCAGRWGVRADVRARTEDDQSCGEDKGGEGGPNRRSCSVMDA